MSEAQPPTPNLPVFPVIVVSVNEDEAKVIGSAPGAEVIEKEIDRQRWDNDIPYRNELTASVAHRVARSINHTEPVRVRVDMGAGQDFHMWMPTAGNRLYEIERPQPLKDSSTKTRWGMPPKMFWASLACVLMVAMTIGALLWKNNQSEPVAIYTPPAAQLPVSAPAGWDTFADYSLEATTAAPVVIKDQILYAKDSELRTVSAKDGVEKGKQSAGFNIDEIHSVDGLESDVIAVGGNNAQAAIGKRGGELHSLNRPTQQAKLHWVSGAPVYTSEGYVWIPDAQGALKKVTAPADTFPVALAGEKVWMASKVEPKAWLMSDDSAKLPKSVDIPAPKGMSYKGPITGVKEHVLFGYSNKNKSTEQKIVITDLNKNGEVGKGRVLEGKWNENSTEVDNQRNLILTGSTLIDVENNKAINAGSNATYGGGYVWTRGTHPARISLNGDEKAWETSSAQPVIPADVDQDGRAIVLYKPTEQDASSKLYVLRKE